MTPVWVTITQPARCARANGRMRSTTGAQKNFSSNGRKPEAEIADLAARHAGFAHDRRQGGGEQIGRDRLCQIQPAEHDEQPLASHDGDRRRCVKLRGAHARPRCSARKARAAISSSSATSGIGQSFRNVSSIFLLAPGRTIATARQRAEIWPRVALNHSACSRSPATDSFRRPRTRSEVRMAHHARRPGPARPDNRARPTPRKAAGTVASAGSINLQIHHDGN